MFRILATTAFVGLAAVGSAAAAVPQDGQDGIVPAMATATAGIRLARNGADDPADHDLFDDRGQGADDPANHDANDDRKRRGRNTGDGGSGNSGSGSSGNSGSDHGGSSGSSGSGSSGSSGSGSGSGSGKSGN